MPRRKRYVRNILDTWRIYNPKGSWKNSIGFWSWIRKSICFPIGLENMEKTKPFMEAGAPKTSQVTLPGAHVLFSGYVPSESENISHLTWKSANVAQNHSLQRILIFICLNFYKIFFFISIYGQQSVFAAISNKNACIDRKKNEQFKNGFALFFV